jgi:hypothetical protein
MSTGKIIGQENYYNGVLHDRLSLLMMISLLSSGPNNGHNSISHQN